MENFEDEVVKSVQLSSANFWDESVKDKAKFLITQIKKILRIHMIKLLTVISALIINPINIKPSIELYLSFQVYSFDVNMTPTTSMMKRRSIQPISSTTNGQYSCNYCRHIPTPVLLSSTYIWSSQSNEIYMKHDPHRQRQ